MSVPRWLTSRRVKTRPRRTVAAGAILGVLALIVTIAPPAVAYPRPGLTERASVASGGGQGNGASTFATALSGDGRFIAFSSIASNLVPADINDTWDVFMHERATGVTERVSVTSIGDEANGLSANPSLSADGRYVAFQSHASNLVTGDTNGFNDVFVHDRETGVTERVSVTSEGDQGNGNSGNFGPSISADGRYVAFSSTSSNLVPGDTNGGDVVWDQDTFVHDRETGVTERVSVASDGTQTEERARSISDSLSADGRYVVFTSNASNLVPGDTNDANDVFVHDRETGVTERVSVASDGGEGDRLSGGASVSADGRYVAFTSRSNLVPGKTNSYRDAIGRSVNANDVFVHDRETGVTERVSVAMDGSEGNEESFSASISADGRYVVFHSDASNLVPEDTNGERDAFVYDRGTGMTERVSVASNGGQANETSGSLESSVSADGRYIAFDSAATNLVPGDTNGFTDMFVRDRGPATGVGALSAVREGSRLLVSGWATFSGQVVASVDDPSDDGTSGAKETGAELTGASLTFRPEAEDLLVRLTLASLPSGRESCTVDDPVEVCEQGGGASGTLAPGVLHQRIRYGVSFQLDGIRYEVRVRTGSSVRVDEESLSDPPRFALHRCDPDCTEQALLRGGIGVSGSEVRTAVPVSELGDSGAEALTAIRAFTAREEGALHPSEALDEVELPDALMPASGVELGIAPASTPEEEVVYTIEADLVEGELSGTVDVSSRAPGEYRLWARACIGSTCGPAVAEVVSL